MNYLRKWKSSRCFTLLIVLFRFKYYRHYIVEPMPGLEQEAMEVTCGDVLRRVIGANIVPSVIPYAIKLYARAPPKALVALDAGKYKVLSLRGDNRKAATWGPQPGAPLL